MRPRLLDLFCGAGGAAVGYHRAGFEVVGVDIRPQPRYPFEHHVADALTFPLDGFDAVHASPPCQDHSRLVTVTGARGTGWLLGAMRARLVSSGLPYVIENVSGALMPGALVLCGTEFGLAADCDDGRRRLRRHRQFESNVPLWGAGGCSCRRWRGRIVGVYGQGRNRPSKGQRGYQASKAEAAAALGIDWMVERELAQAIPPAYTEHIGEFLLDHLRHARESADA